MSRWSVVLIGLLVAACGQPSGATPTTEVSTTLATPVTTTIPVTTTVGHSDRVQQAIDDLASRLNVDAAVITLVSDEDVTWSDGSLGCPEPGKAYTQAEVPGYRIKLAVADKTYNYHGGSGSGPFYCEPGLNRG